jgi:hypothetical protein
LHRPRQVRERPSGRDHSSWTYAVPGVISWSIIVASLVGVAFFPASWKWAVTVFLGYMICYTTSYFIFGLVGEYKRRRAEKVDWTAGEDVVGPFGFRPADVRHAVIVPNYKEPDDVLERTVAALAAQHRASQRIVLVLGMEAREPGAYEKGMAIADRYRDEFLRVVVSVHPTDVPGELACKAANQTYAAIGAHKLMVEELGIPIDHITVSTCDADSVFHPKYFSALSQMFAHDRLRNSRIWQAPLFYYNNIWKVPAPIRFTAWFIHAGQLAELAMPFYEGLPISTYTLSMRLAEETQFWDPAVISEDWHVYLGVMFARDGDVSVAPIFLPTYSDSTDGATPWQAIVNRYLQLMRHSFGAEDVGFLLRTLLDERRLPRAITVFRSLQVLHDHTMRVAAWFMVISAYILDFGAVRTAMASTVYPAVGSPAAPLHVVLGWFLTLGLGIIATCVAVEVIRNPKPGDWAFGRLAIEVVVLWLCLPVIGFALGVAPAIHAQTRLMFRLPLAWRVTPKALVDDVAPEAA